MVVVMMVSRKKWGRYRIIMGVDFETILILFYFVKNDKNVDKNDKNEIDEVKKKSEEKKRSPFWVKKVFYKP